MSSITAVSYFFHSTMDSSWIFVSAQIQYLTGGGENMFSADYFCRGVYFHTMGGLGNEYVFFCGVIALRVTGGDWIGTIMMMCILSICVK